MSLLASSAAAPRSSEHQLVASPAQLAAVDSDRGASELQLELPPPLLVLLLLAGDGGRSARWASSPPVTLDSSCTELAGARLRACLRFRLMGVFFGRESGSPEVFRFGRVMAANSGRCSRRGRRRGRSSNSSDKRRTRTAGRRRRRRRRRRRSSKSSDAKFSREPNG